MLSVQYHTMRDGESMKTKFGNASINENGYYCISSKKEGNYGKPLHRLIFEEFYQITLPSNIVVHHDDGNKLNNNIWNLIPLTRAEHIELHNRERIVSDETKEKMSKIHKGKIISEEQKQKIRESTTGDKNHFYGKNHSNETKKKISECSKKYSFCGDNTQFKKTKYRDNALRRCFIMIYDYKPVPIGTFLEWTSCDVISNLIKEAIDCH